MEDADVPARVSSTVASLPATSREGMLVETGQVLATLDTSDFEEEVTMSRQALADLDAQLQSIDVEEEAARKFIEIDQQELAIHRRELERVEEAVAREAAMPREVDQIRKQVLTAEQTVLRARETLDRIQTRRLAIKAQRSREEASLRLAQERVARCTIKSPIAGFIDSIDVDLGESLSAGSRVARIIDPRAIEVPLRLAASARGEVRVQDEVELSTTGSRTRVWSARITRVSPQDDPSNRTLTVYAEVMQPMSGDHHLPPGAFLHGEVTSRNRTQSWVVPRRSIRKDRILVVRDGVVMSVPVSVAYAVSQRFEQFGVPDLDWVVLENSLQDNELIVLSPSRTLADGMRVLPVPVQESLAAVTGESKQESHP
jgi:membrane fusion protein (multidrug efflux system)